jgi:CubicO group peptidase (beta-lactamase class C family)
MPVLCIPSTRMIWSWSHALARRQVTMTTAIHSRVPEGGSARDTARGRPDVSDVALGRATDEILHRRPAVGLAVSVARDGHSAWIGCRGLADIASSTPVAEDTVFRIASVTKLFTAIAVMQLWEQGRVDLDAPANDYLRAYRLVARRHGWRPATLRHLLTHTAGIPDARGIADLRHGDLTPAGGRPPLMSVPAGERVPSLAEHYRGSLDVVIEPGTAFTYSNHGFATLGQIIEDVSGQPLGSYLREHIFEPLGMADTDLERSDRVRSWLATGYALGRSGPQPVPDREWIGAGGGGIYSTPRDMTRFIESLLGGGRNGHGAILQTASLATMYEPHYQPDPRLPGMGLGFFRGEVDGHRVVIHDGILPGFNSALLLAPDDGVGLFAVTNGASGAFAWLPDELHRLLRGMLGGADDDVRGNAPHHPEVWSGLLGRYVFPPGAADLRMRLMLGAGAEVVVDSGRLKARLLLPIPVAYRGFELEPADEVDPDVFRLDLSHVGMAPVRVVFARDGERGVSAVHTDLGGQPWSLVRKSDAGGGRRLGSAIAAMTVVGLLAAGWRRRRPRHGIRT